ncbi:unnamed protein product [Mycena citricolor]|uniref:Uncharacterized protein n=1 Tax=Mycena citricolor TaxID=2018698 RepID=A0AAD2HY47_9AGAR|nr:unnamed protein product [Mycena citricolor]
MPQTEIVPYSGRRDGSDMLITDFIRAVRKHIAHHQYATTADQIDVVNLYLKPDSPAEEHMLALLANSPARASLDAYLAELKANFPGVQAMKRSKGELEAELLRSKITLAELAEGTVTRGGVRLSVQDDYANRVEDLAIEAIVQGQIGGFHLWLENQPAVLQAALTPAPATWTDVAAAIRGVPASEVNRATDAHRANAALQQQVDQLSRSMQTMRIAPVAPRTQTTFPAASRPSANPPASIAPNIQAQRGTPPTATQNPRPDLPQFGRDYVPTQDELTHIRAARELVVSIAQPDTEQGRATYAQQKAQWLHDTQNERATRTLRLWEKGHPLSPGTLIPGSRECWRCGMARHDGDCTAPYITGDECRFRFLCHSWLTGRRAAPPANAPPAAPVNAIHWYQIGAPAPKDFQAGQA